MTITPVRQRLELVAASIPLSPAAPWGWDHSLTASKSNALQGRVFEAWGLCSLLRNSRMFEPNSVPSCTRERTQAVWELLLWAVEDQQWTCGQTLAQWLLSSLLERVMGSTMTICSGQEGGQIPRFNRILTSLQAVPILLNKGMVMFSFDSKHYWEHVSYGEQTCFPFQEEGGGGAVSRSCSGKLNPLQHGWVLSHQNQMCKCLGLSTSSQGDIAWKGGCGLPKVLLVLGAWDLSAQAGRGLCGRKCIGLSLNSLFSLPPGLSIIYCGRDQTPLRVPTSTSVQFLCWQHFSKVWMDQGPSLLGGLSRALNLSCTLICLIYIGDLCKISFEKNKFPSLY